VVIRTQAAVKQLLMKCQNTLPVVLEGPVDLEPAKIAGEPETLGGLADVTGRVSESVT
jgi:hypothetical protein